jgi:LysM repeat protein
MTYNQVGQVITYTYVILNNGNITLQGPFSIADDRAAANCTQPDDNLLSPNEEMSCTASYSITQDNLNTTSVTNNATASNGTTTSNIATIMISTTGAVPPSSLVPGTDIEYQVKDGEWLWQIARCYGAHPKDVIDRNRPKLGNPAKLLAGMTLTVPNIGSTGTIYGPPCIRMHTVVSGDTWASIAQQYGADSNLIQKVNSIGLVPGNQVRVPVGPYNYP